MDLEIVIGRPLFDINCKIFLSVFSGKGNINKNKQLDLIKLKSFCTATEIIDKMKRQLTEWEKIFASDVTKKRLISKIYKQLIQLNIKKLNNPIIIWAEGSNRHFSKEHIQMANRHMKKILRITNHQRNTNQNSELSPHT